MTSKAFVGVDPIYAPARPNKSVKGNSGFLTKNGYFDTRWGGMYSLRGTTKVAGTPDIPVGRRVVLLHERFLRISRAMVSDPLTGEYVFNNISNGPWTVISWDNTGEYNAVIGSNAPSEPM